MNPERCDDFLKVTHDLPEGQDSSNPGFLRPSSVACPDSRVPKSGLLFLCLPCLWVAKGEEPIGLPVPLGTVVSGGVDQCQSLSLKETAIREKTPEATGEKTRRRGVFLPRRKRALRFKKFRMKALSEGRKCLSKKMLACFRLHRA